MGHMNYTWPSTVLSRTRTARGQENKEKIAIAPMTICFCSHPACHGSSTFNVNVQPKRKTDFFGRIGHTLAIGEELVDTFVTSKDGNRARDYRRSILSIALSVLPLPSSCTYKADIASSGLRHRMTLGSTFMPSLFVTSAYNKPNLSNAPLIEDYPYRALSAHAPFICGVYLSSQGLAGM